MEAPIEIADVPNAQPLSSSGHIQFNEVHFHYGSGRPILKIISFEVPAGKTVAIVGPSGAGESTISRLLYRFYDLKKGTITIDGQDISMVQQDGYRAAIGMVPQDTVLFNDTIEYNIRYGALDASEAEIAQAATYAKIDKLLQACQRALTPRLVSVG